MSKLSRRGLSVLVQQWKTLLISRVYKPEFDFYNNSILAMKELYDVVHSDGFHHLSPS